MRMTLALLGGLFLVSHRVLASASLDAAQCFKRPIQEVDLSMQLGPTKSQEGGTCYAYAAVAALEAAAYRVDGVQRNISAEAAAAHFIRLNPSNDESRRFQQVKSGGYYLSGGYVDETMDSLLQLDYFADSEAFRKYWNNLNLFHRGAANSTLPHESREGESIHDKFVNFITARIVGRPDDIKKEWMQNDVATVLGHYERKNKPKIETEHKKFKRETLFKDYDLAEIYMKQRPPIDTKEPRPAGASAGAIGLESPVKDCGLDNPKVKSNVENIMKHLCSGIPVAASMAMHGTKTSSYGNFSTASKYEGSDHAWHAMLIQGVRILDGEPHFVFRNSWADGYADPKQKSEAYLPFSEACKLSSASVYLTPNDPPVGQSNTRCEGPKPGEARPIECLKISYRESGGESDSSTSATSQESHQSKD